MKKRFEINRESRHTATIRVRCESSLVRGIKLKGDELAEYEMVGVDVDPLKHDSWRIEFESDESADRVFRAAQAMRTYLQETDGIEPL